MSPLISLITTVYNRQHYLQAAINSVLAQTYPNFELLIWDDGSSDESLRIAQRCAHQDERVKVFAAPHQGRALALQSAHTQATGDYLGWVDSDDLLAATALAETATILDTHPHIGLVYTNYWLLDAAGSVKGLGQRCQIPYSPDRLLVDFMTFHFLLFRHRAFEQAGGINPDFPAAIDYDLCLRLSEVTEVMHLPRPLYYYRVHHHSISGAQRLTQIEYARTAIAQALQRRGLADHYDIEVQIESRFVLQKKHNCRSFPE
jgi:glycosyltransferase involved in cell wall biosynthesis